MTSVPSGSATPFDQPGPLRPAAWWYLVAVVVLLGGAALTVRGAFHMINNIRDHYHELQPGEARTISFEGGRSQSVYAVWRGGGSGVSMGSEIEGTRGGPDIDLTITGPDGEDVDYRAGTSATTTIDYGGKHGVKVGSFTPPTDGDYELQGTFEEQDGDVGDADLIGVSSFRLARDIRNVLLPAALGFLGGLGIILWVSITRGVEKGRRRRLLREAGYAHAGQQFTHPMQGPPQLPNSGPFS